MVNAFFLLQSLFENKPTPPYTYGLGKVDTTSGSEHTTRQNRTEVKPDGARETSGERVLFTTALDSQPLAPPAPRPNPS